MEKVFQIIGEHYMISCLVMLALQILLLFFATRTGRDSLYLLSVVAPVLSAFITYHLPKAGLSLYEICIVFIFLFLDAVMMTVTVFVRANDDSKKSTLLWKVAWLVLILGFAAAIILDKL